MTRQGKVLAREIDAYLAFWEEARAGKEVCCVISKRFVVINNTPGYLPEEDDPATFEDLSSAREYLKEEVERYCEHLEEVDEPFSVWWNKELDYAKVDRTSYSHDLGRVFEIAEDEDEDV